MYYTASYGLRFAIKCGCTSTNSAIYPGMAIFIPKVIPNSSKAIINLSVNYIYNKPIQTKPTRTPTPQGVILPAILVLTTTEG